MILPENPPPRRVTLLPMLAIVALGFALRTYELGSEGLWIDEAFSVWLARQPLDEMVRWVARIDQHPPLYYALLHGWIRLVGDGEMGVRALSAFLSTATIPVIYRLGRRLAAEHVGLLSALILAVSPFHVRFAQEARMYALLTLNASLAMLAISSLGPSRFRLGQPATLLYVVATAATLWTHNTAIFLPLAITLFVLVGRLCRRPPRPPACPELVLSPVEGRSRRTPLPVLSVAEGRLCALAPLLLWLPWLPAFVAQAIGVYRRFWLAAPTPGTVVSAVGALLIDSLPLPPVPTSVVTVALAALALWGLTRLRRPVAAFLLTLFATPFVGEVLVSLWRPIFYTRTLIWTSIPLYVLMAAGMETCPTSGISCKSAFHSRRFIEGVRRHGRPSLTIITLVALLAVNGLALRNYYHNFEKEQWEEAAGLVADRVAPDDLILFNATWGQIPFDYYLRQLYNQPLDEHGVPVDLFERGVLEPPMTEDDLPRLQALVEDRERVWLVYSHDWYTDPGGLIPASLEERYDLLGRWEFHGVQVWEYGRGEDEQAERLTDTVLARPPVDGDLAAHSPRCLRGTFGDHDPRFARIRGHGPCAGRLVLDGTG